MKRVHVLLCVVAIASAGQAETPTLSVSQVPPANVQLLWPSNFPNWQLTFATNLSLANWQVITQAPVISGTSLLVSLSLTNVNGFFRLQQNNGGGSGACTFQATPPQISPGASSSLTWCPEAGTTYRISPGPGIVAGNNLTVSPTVTTVYTLIASNATAMRTNYATVVVGPCGWLQVSNWNVEMDFTYQFSKSTANYNFKIYQFAFVTFHLFRLASSTDTDAYYFGFAVPAPDFDDAELVDQEDDMTGPEVFTTKESNPLFTKPDHTVCSMSLHLTCSTYDFSYNILAPVTETTAFGTFMQTDGIGTGAVAARPLSTTTNVISSNSDIQAVYPPVAGDYFTPSSDVGKALFTTGTATSGSAGTAAVFWNFAPAP